MAIAKRRDSPFWWYDFTVRGRRFRGSCETPDRETAKAIEAKLRSDALLGVIAGHKPAMSLDQALGRYWLEHACHKPSSPNIEYQAKNLLARLGKGTMLDELSDSAIAGYVARRRGDTHGRRAKQRVSPSSVNREVTLLRAVLNKARRAWGAEVAEINWPAHFLIEPAPRDRILKAEEVDRLLTAAADHLRAPIRFSLMTGVRLANCIGLDWSQVDMRSREIALKVKSQNPGGKPHVVPMSEDVLVLLATLGPRDHGRVFRYQGRPIKSWQWAWRKALKRAGIADFRWHDLRHTAATWMVREGVRLDVVQDVLGHEDIKTTMRYVARDTREKRAAIEAAASRLRHVALPEAGPRRRKVVLSPRVKR